METIIPNSISNSPNKRLKTETLTLDSSIDKGKAPIIADESEDDDDDGDYESPTPENCGVCLSEEGKSIRGLIDSCDHYFCFLCIIEWSKIESRCPLCRGRFSSIRRMRKDGSFIGSSSVRVPVRDQIYDPFGEPPDPYRQAKCSVCNGTTDECLLLLCDLCDSASHTFCVGLGATVPEGDWYCKDCTLLRAEQCENEIRDNVVTSTASPHPDEPLSTSASVSIFDIVRDPNESIHDSGTARLRELATQHPKKISSSGITSDSSNIASARSVPVARGNVDVSASSARTLQNCRNVHRHITVLRENWDAFRSGSLSFSHAFSKSPSEGGEKKNLGVTIAKRASILQSFSSTSSSQSKAADSSCETKCNKEPYNVDKAWKLMTIAKKVQRTDKSKSASKVTENKVNSLKKDNFVQPKRVVSGRKDLMSRKIEKQEVDEKATESPAQSARKHHSTSFSASVLGSKRQKSAVNKLSMARGIQTASKANSHRDGLCSAPSKNLKGPQSIVIDDSSACSSPSIEQIAEASDLYGARLQREISAYPVNKVGHLNISSSNKGELQTSRQADIAHDKTDLSSSSKLGRGLSNNFDKNHGYACSTSSSCEQVVGGSGACHVNLEGKKVPAYPRKVGEITSKSSKDDEAKSEIQSLVKLNLKLLSKDKRLGVDEFKDIARLSTHTILASCGFEHRKIVRSTPILVCPHDDQTQPLHRSTIMPNSCRKCFYVFVQNVVQSIMSEKLNSVEFAC